jgi:hypothetical protein
MYVWVYRNDTNNQNPMHKEIKSRLNMGNACFERKHFSSLCYTNSFINIKTKENKNFACYLTWLFYQYSETNVMHFLFSLLRIKGLYMFRALIYHPQEALH